VARPGRKVGFCRLVIVDHQGIAAGPPLALGDQRERDAAFGLQDGVDDIANPDERRSLMPPKGFPDPFGDGVGVVWPLMQLEDAERH
jgi:hypothetical protein